MENEEGEISILPDNLTEKIKSIAENVSFALKKQFSSVQMAKNHYTEEYVLAILLPDF